MYDVRMTVVCDLQWEKRKGWDLLLKAFTEEFKVRGRE
jgi:hypothetical protein